MFKRTLENISERRFFGELLYYTFKAPERLSSIAWGRKYVTLTSKQSTLKVGEFDPNISPTMEYVYDCLDNPGIPVIVSRKSARIGWTTVLNVYRSKRIHLQPCIMWLGFPTLSQTRKFATGQWKEWVTNIPILQKLINVGVAKNKENMFQFNFPNGQLNLLNMSSISNQKSDNVPYIEWEEPDDMKDNIAGQGNSLKNVEQRQKTVPLALKKLIFGGTPTNKGFSKVDEAVNSSNMLIFKAECHGCGELIPMDGKSFDFIRIDSYDNMYIDEIYGKYNPKSAIFECPCCGIEWDFNQKTENLINGKKFGFIDHTGNHSKGWHPKYPDRIERFGFIFSELQAVFEDGSSYESIAKDLILANKDLEKGDEGALKSFYNNRRGEAYASGVTALDLDELITWRSNYSEGIIPYQGLLPYMGIDVQHNRFAIVQLALGRNGNVYLVKWFEIFGNVLNWNDPVWGELTNIVRNGLPHVTGKMLPYERVGIDSGDGGTTELVYRWVRLMREEYKEDVKATKGCKEIKYSRDDIYSEPQQVVVQNLNQLIPTLAEKMGVIVYHLGTHACHDEILRRLGLNKRKDETGKVIATHDVFYFNEQSYGGWEEQMLACRKIVTMNRKTGINMTTYKLEGGKHMDAMAATKNAIWCSYEQRVREFSEEKWQAIEKYVQG